jgi:hypothetical protein
MEILRNAATQEKEMLHEGIDRFNRQEGNVSQMSSFLPASMIHQGRAAGPDNKSWTQDDD